MCKLNKWTVVKTLVFVGGIFLIYKILTAEGAEATIDGQNFKVYGKDANEFVKEIMERTEL